MPLLSSALLALLLPLAPVAPQQAEAQQPGLPTPVLTVNARAVTANVVVTDKHGKPVTGLHKEDFQLFEDGTPQRITAFEEHPSALPGPTPAPALPPNTFSNVLATPTGGPLTVLLLDTLNTPLADQARLKKELEQTLLSWPATTPLAIYTLGTQLRCVQSFTTDPAALRAAAARLTTDSPNLVRTSGEDQSDQTTLAAITEADPAGHTASKIARFQAAQQSLTEDARALATLQAMEDLAHNLAGLPGRKNVAWLSASFPIALTTPEIPFEAQRDDADQTEAANTALLAAQVAIYPVATSSSAGVASLYSTDTHLAAHTGSAAAAETSIILGADGQVRDRAQASMEQIADATGGRTFSASTPLQKVLSQVSELGAHYYTLVYTPTAAPDREGYRLLSVKLSDPHLKLVYERGYYSRQPNPPSPDQQPAPDPLRPYMAPGTLDATGLPFAAQAALADTTTGCSPAASAEGAAAAKCVVVHFLLTPHDLALVQFPTDNREDTLELMLVATTADSKALNGTASTVRLHLSPAQYARLVAQGLELPLAIPVPASAATLRAGVLDTQSGRAGTLQIPLDHLSAAPLPPPAPTPTVATGQPPRLLPLRPSNPRQQHSPP